MKPSEEKILFALKKILTQYPDTIVGGSIAMLSRGYINRAPGDIDLITDQFGRFTDSEMVKQSTEIGSQQIDMIDGEKITRLSIEFLGVPVCIFRVTKRLMKFDEVTYKGLKFKAQAPEYQIKAKKMYSERGYTKHTEDLESYFQTVINTK